MARRGASCCVLGWRGCSCQAQLHTFDTATFRRGYKITTRVAFTMLHSSSVHVADAQAMVSFSGTSQQQIIPPHLAPQQQQPNSYQGANPVCAQRRIRGFLQFKKCLGSSQCQSYWIAHAAATPWYDIAGTLMVCPTLSERCSHSRGLFALSSSNALRLIHRPLVSTPVYRRDFHVSRCNFTRLTMDSSAVVLQPADRI